MMKYSLFFVLTFCCVLISSAQNKNEREHRIRKSQFPAKALEYVYKELVNAKRIRFYKEIDSTKVSYAAKFKEDRLRYSIEFNKEGTLRAIEFAIQPLDIPEDAFEKMSTYLKLHFTKHKIRRLKQQYLVTHHVDLATTVENAFQNLIVPTIIYELIVSGKNENNFEQHEVLFDANGRLKSIKKSLPPNYDHVLY